MVSYMLDAFERCLMDARYAEAYYLIRKPKEESRLLDAGVSGFDMY